MPQLAETIYAPELDGGKWLQGGPISLRALRGRAALLIDFWDFTCVNCIRTLPYVAEWNRRYADRGLVIVGVHAPEFSFAREASHVGDAAARFQLDYPIILDNDYAIWRAYSNRFWPAKYIVDRHGRIRYYHYGEGSYGETEGAIQHALKDLNNSLELPPPMAPVRDDDAPGAVCYRVTPELYLGHSRGQFGNPSGVSKDVAVSYVDPGRRMEGLCYLDGRWRVEQEFARAEAPGAALSIRYTSKDVNLVMAPPPGAAIRLELKLGAGERTGADVEIENGRAFVTVSEPRMYNLVTNDSVMAGALTLSSEQAGLAAYAFTFVSCAVA
jgi:thiol-disulfide isomerase/thioredoxin